MCSKSVSNCISILLLFSYVLICHGSNNTNNQISSTLGSDNVAISSVLNQILEVIKNQASHSKLYERIAILEFNYNSEMKKTERLKEEIDKLNSRIPILEMGYESFVQVMNQFQKLESKMENLVQDYEAKLSALAGEVIRLKTERKNDPIAKTMRGRDPIDAMLKSEDEINNNLKATNVTKITLENNKCPKVGFGLSTLFIDDHCIYYTESWTLEWNSARLHCESIGGSLISAKMFEDISNVFVHQDDEELFWIGTFERLDDNTLKIFRNDTSLVVTNNNTLTNMDPDNSVLFAPEMEDPLNDWSNSTTLENNSDNIPTKSLINIKENKTLMKENNTVQNPLKETGYPKDKMLHSKNDSLPSNGNLNNKDTLGLIELLDDVNHYRIKRRIPRHENIIDIVDHKDTYNPDIRIDTIQHLKKPRKNKKVIQDLMKLATDVSHRRIKRHTPDTETINNIKNKNSYNPDITIDKIQHLKKVRTDTNINKRNSTVDNLLNNVAMCMAIQRNSVDHFEFIAKPCDNKIRFICDVAPG